MDGYNQALESVLDQHAPLKTERELYANITSHGTALRLVMQLEVIGSWRESGEHLSKVKTSGQPLINRGK